MLYPPTMRYRVKTSRPEGEVAIPGSKSHTIRALVCGLLAGGESAIEAPLDSADTRSCLAMVQSFGAGVREESGRWIVSGRGGRPVVPDDVVDVGNSGTSLYMGLGVAALAEGISVFTGDGQIRSRPAGPLLASLRDLGCMAESTRGNDIPPLVIRGRMKGGRTSVEAHTSQYLSSLLLAAPCADGETRIEVPLLNEAPYVAMTLSWMDRLGIEYKNDGMKRFVIPGGQSYRPFTGSIPADFSSAAFFIVAAAVTGSRITLKGLDLADTQGDRAVVDIVESMGARVERGERAITIEGGTLKGGTFDLNAIPDALPALAVAGCLARGETRLVNVPQARLKETDRIAVMRSELSKMGADIEEKPDGLVIRGGGLKGALLHGHGDHRVVMALSVAGMAAGGETTIDTAESAAVTFPAFGELMSSLGADIELLED
ncbi:MAG: 3-phosphoshikimate 1-carboxyvinyltransferase [Spirochaetes bacterium ADurb.BinA120]|nr:MAG: 3-phosphoshikimate 1-carboxyvinyltransferase [Spirochaetes bacterium ADurb.BinA120]